MIVPSLRNTLSRWRSFRARGSLGHKVLEGGAWLVVADMANRGMGLLKLVILARLLAPADFGLIALANLLLTWFDYFSQTGFSMALIRKTGDIRPYLNTFWTVQVARGLAMSAGLFLLAPLGARVFHNDGLTSVVRAISGVLLLRGFLNPAIVYFRRDLNIAREVFWRFGGAAFGLVVAVPLAFMWRNVWALVASVLAAALCDTVLSYYLIGFRPRPEIHWSKVRELAGFGKWVFWSNIIEYLSLNADSWVVGRWFGTIPIGYYQMAQQIGPAPAGRIGAHAAAVTFPAFSRLQQQGDLRGAFLRSFGFVVSVMLPIGVGMTVFADLLVRLVLGERWMPIAPPLRILIWGGVITALTGVTTAFLQAAGRPDLPARGLLLKVLAFGVLVYPLAKYAGLTGVAAAAACSSPVSFLYQYALVARALKADRRLMPDLRSAAIACLPFFAAGLVTPFAHSTYIAASLGILAAMACGLILFRPLVGLLKSG